ncbi:MAG: OsmC family protein [Chloroflexota bacterium]|nr:OsmC family protein [Chloroflexota bacterium]
MTSQTDETTSLPEISTPRERQGVLKQRYRDDPGSARQTTAVYSVTDDVTDPTRVRIAVDGPSGAVIDIGAHHSVGGDGELPCSGDIFLAALAGCQEITIRLVASALGLPLHRLAVRVEGDWDARGTLAVDRETPVGYTAIRIDVELQTDGPDDRVERLLKAAERYCVVGATLGDAPTVAFNATVNGELQQAPS